MNLITFDFHNTLASCDTWFELEVFTIAAEVAAFNDISVDKLALTTHYRDVRAEVIRSGIEVSATDGVNQTFAAHGVDLAVETVAASVDQLMRNALTDLSAKPGAVDTVRFLKSQGHQLGVISSAAHHEFVESALESFQILDQFEFVLTSVRAGIYKSMPQIYLQAMERVNAHAARSLHIGDSLKWDVETSSRAGMRTAWIVTEQRLGGNVEPDLTFESLVDAGPAIDRYVRSLD